MVIDDYAHHPTEINVTLDGIRRGGIGDWSQYFSRIYIHALVTSMLIWSFIFKFRYFYLYGCIPCQKKNQLQELPVN